MTKKSAKKSVTQTVAAPSPAKPPVEPDTLGDRISLVDRIGALEKLLRANTSPLHPARFRIFGVLPAGDLNGDNTVNHDAEYVKAWRMFRRLPIEEQRRILNGWEPTAFETEHLREDSPLSDDLPACGCLELMGFGEYREPRARFTAMDADVAPPVVVNIKAGTSKAEAMNALERLIDDVDVFWDWLVTDPENAAKIGKQYSNQRLKDMRFDVRDDEESDHAA